jgi:hypothetical protein
MKSFSCTSEATQQKNPFKCEYLSDYVQFPNHNHSMRNYSTGLYIQHTLQNDSQTNTLCYTAWSQLFPSTIPSYFYPKSLKPETQLNNI